MKKFLATALVLLWALAPAGAQSISVPAEVKVPAGPLVVIQPDKVDADDAHWFSLDPGLQPFPANIFGKPPVGTFVGLTNHDGTYRLGVVTTKALKQPDGSFKAAIGPVKWVKVTVGDPSPTVPITFTPQELPPGTLGAAYSQTVTVAGTQPLSVQVASVSDLTGLKVTAAGNSVTVQGTPTAAGVTVFTVTARDAGGATRSQAYSVAVAATPAPPVPPAPIPDKGLRVLMTFDTKAVGSMPPAQQSVLYAKEVRDWLNSNTVLGPDGKTHEWRIWDNALDASKDPSTALKALYARPRQQPNWIAISNGTSGYEGPLPADVPSALALLKKYAP